MREGEARKYRLINEKRDLEEYTMRQAHLRRMATLERKWLEAGPRGQASQAMRARRLMDSGMDASRFYAPQAIEAARALKSTDDLSQAIGKLGHAYRAGGGHALAFTDSQHAVHAALRGVSGALGALWLTYGKFITVMVAATAATLAVKRSFELGVEFEYQTRFAAALGDTTESVDALQDTLKTGLMEASKTAYGSAVELANGLRIMQQAGYDAALAINSIGVVSQAALVGESDMKTAAEDLVAVLEIFGMHSNDPTVLARNFKYAGDVMAYVAKETRANLRDVASSFQNVIGVSEAYNVKIETVAALTEKLGKAGIVAGRAGTFIRNFFDNALGVPTEKAKGILKSIGVEAFDFSKDDPVEWMDRLKSKVQEFDAISQTAIENGLFTDRGIKVWRAYIAEAESLAEATKRIGDASKGALQEVSDNVRKAVKVEFKEAFDALDDSLTQAFSNAEEGTSRLANALKEAFTDPALISAIATVTEMLANAAASALEFINRRGGIVNLPTAIIQDTTEALGFNRPKVVGESTPGGSRESVGVIKQRNILTGELEPLKPAMSSAPGVNYVQEALARDTRVVGTKKWDPKSAKGQGGLSGADRGADRALLKGVQGASKLANAEYEQAMASVEFYKQGLDLRKNARMVGEKEYQETLDALAELEIQKGIDRENAIQKAIEEAIPKAKDQGTKDQLLDELAASLQKEQTLMTRAYTDKALAQLKAEISRKEFLDNVEKLEAESFGTRLTAQQQFIRDWNANNQALMDRAMADGDMESFMRLLNIKDRGMEDAKKEDRLNLATLFPEDDELRMEALRARHMKERDELLKLTREGSEERHRLERELEYRHGLEMAQERLTAFSQFMSAGEQLAGGMANLVGMVAGEQSEAYRVMFAASKAFAIADATMNMYTAISKAMAFEGPMGWAQIGPVMASMSALIGQISSVNYAGAFDKGGIIPSGKWGIVGEYGPEIVQGPANVTSREKTASLLRGDGQKASAAPAAPAQVNVRNINVLDPQLVGEYLGTDDGEKLIMNVIQRNRSALRT